MSQLSLHYRERQNARPFAQSAEMEVTAWISGSYGALKRQKDWLAFTPEARLSIDTKFRTTMWVAPHLRLRAATLTRRQSECRVGPQPHRKLWVLQMSALALEVLIEYQRYGVSSRRRPKD